MIMVVKKDDTALVRKWNSKQLNNGIMTAEFQVPVHIETSSFTLLFIRLNTLLQKFKVKIKSV